MSDVPKGMPRERIGGFLLRIGAITEKQKEEILELQKTKYPDKMFGQIAIELGYIKKESIDKYIESKNS